MRLAGPRVSDHFGVEAEPDRGTGCRLPGICTLAAEASAYRRLATHPNGGGAWLPASASSSSEQLIGAARSTRLRNAEDLTHSIMDTKEHAMTALTAWTLDGPRHWMERTVLLDTFGD